MKCKLCGEEMTKQNCSISAEFAFHSQNAVDVVITHEHKKDGDDCGACCNAFIELDGCVFYDSMGNEMTELTEVQP